MLSFINCAIYRVANAGLSELMYNFWNIAGVLIVAIVFLVYARHFNIKWFKALLCVILVFLFIDFASLWALWIEAGFNCLSSKNFALGFVYAPLACFVIGKIFRVPYKILSDWLAPMPLLLFAIFRIGCISAGCCMGYPVKWGIYNPLFNDYLFLVQLLESLLSVAIQIFLMIRMKKRNYVPDGKAMPLMLAIYGAVRFLTEFLRQNEKLFLGISAAALHSLFMCAAGIVILLCMRRFGKKEEQKELPVGE